MISRVLKNLLPGYHYLLGSHSKCLLVTHLWKLLEWGHHINVNQHIGCHYRMLNRETSVQRTKKTWLLPSTPSMAMPWKNTNPGSSGHDTKHIYPVPNNTDQYINSLRFLQYMAMNHLIHRCLWLHVKFKTFSNWFYL